MRGRGRGNAMRDGKLGPEKSTEQIKMKRNERQKPGNFQVKEGREGWPERKTKFG